MAPALFSVPDVYAPFCSKRALCVCGVLACRPLYIEQECKRLSRRRRLVIIEMRLRCVFLSIALITLAALGLPTCPLSRGGRRPGPRTRGPPSLHASCLALGSTLARLRADGGRVRLERCPYFGQLC